LRKEDILLPRIPVSAYRLQFNSDFTFNAAREIIPYLNKLGITDIYASPYFKARSGSLHGYDIVDPTELNPEIGTEDQYDALVAELQKHGMGQILDIVPNHMCVASKDNVWWMDVLENGPSSFYASFFDIEWNPLKAELRNKVLLPILGDQYGRVLENQDMQLVFENGAFFVSYYEHRLPLAPETYLFILGHRLDELREILAEGDPHLIELESIITALEHLPVYTETDGEKKSERNREKEIIKKRLQALSDASADLEDFIRGNVRILNGTKGNPSSFDLLDELLGMQPYRLSYWRVATEEINYRRFFDINDLAAIRTEVPVVFEKTHSLIFRFIREGEVTGLRVDHPDGLYNPSEYFQWLQRNSFLNMRLGYTERVREVISSDIPKQIKEDMHIYSEQDAINSEILKLYDEIIADNATYKPFYIVGEKILIKDERMPEDWPIFSTTGYVFLNTVNGIFVKTENARSFDEIYARFIRAKMDFQDLVYENKKLIMQVAMSSELNTLGHYLNVLSEKNRHTRDFTLNSLTAAIIEVVAFFPVYRTYINPSGVNDRDRHYIELAISKAQRKNPAISAAVFDFLKDVFLFNGAWNPGTDHKNERMDFIMRFQQITGPVMAKGLEDTVFYVYNRLLSLNEVGGSPDRFGISLDTFHGKNIERIKFWPNALITTSTHDTKRSEDVRARINVLSEIPDEWRECLSRWGRINKKNKLLVDGQRVPDHNEEYLIYQTIIGAWPPEIGDETEYDDFKKRTKDYVLKAVREAKLNSSWINPNTIYEEALTIFIDRLMNNAPGNQFLKNFQILRDKIIHYGMYNSLSQTLLKITSPGVPDFYQGTELWNFRLVDPDNRQPVDYCGSAAQLEELMVLESEKPLYGLARDLTLQKENGKIKLYLIYKALNYRNKNKELFERGEYLPLEVMGKKAKNVCAFARRIGNTRTTIIVPRFFTELIPEYKSLPLGETVWEGTFVIMPIAEPGAKYRNVFTDEIVIARDYKEATALYLSDVFANFPVAVLERL
jgi:(1->4)-alpha-D-glucan 1-alpha-D-glucosylmutase